MERGMFKRSLILALTALVCWALPGAAGVAPGGPAPSAKPAVSGSSYLVGAYYYVWYPDNFDHGWLRNRLSPKQLPVLGQYDSTDPEVIQRHISWASRNGLDFFALNWWPNRPEQNRAITDHFLKAPNIGDIRFCIFYETWDLGYNCHAGNTIINPVNSDKLVSDLLGMAETLFDHPSYLKVNGRPVVIFYLSRTLCGEVIEAFTRLRAEFKKIGVNPFFIGDEVFWKVTDLGSFELTAAPQAERIGLFDALTSYNMYESLMPQHEGYGAGTSFFNDVKAVYDKYLSVGQGVSLVPDVFPGFNDRGCRHLEDHYVIPRQWDAGASEGSFFSHYLDVIGLPYIDWRLGMLMVTSWNEWNEDTAIEPLSEQEGTSGDDSDSGVHFTLGYEYAGVHTGYLHVLRDKVCAVHGRARDWAGLPQPGIWICAWRQGQAVDCGRTDTQGYFTISRRSLDEGLYQLGRAGDQHRADLALAGGAPSVEVDLLGGSITVFPQ